MVAFKRVLEEGSLAPQWIDTLEPSSPGEDRGGQLAVANCSRQPGGESKPQVPLLPALREQEVLSLSAMAEPANLFNLSATEEELLRASLDSIDYLGDWACPLSADSIVTCCEFPGLVESSGGAEYTCVESDFTSERRAMHERVIVRMLSSHRNGERSERPAGGGPLGPVIAAHPEQQHIFLVVGVPGSGKDSVLKRYLRTLGLSLLDASADLVKEYLAAWGSDELSVRVREHDRAHGPGKHLLHAQYLHRESILLNDLVVERALAEGHSIMLEKTLHDGEHVLEHARRFRERGCRVHLLGTHITPLSNWEFLRNRMASGAAFGRYISKAQAIASLRRYHAHVGEILTHRSKRVAFDSIHMFDVLRGEWCVRIPDTQVAYAEDEEGAGRGGAVEGGPTREGGGTAGVVQAQG